MKEHDELPVLRAFIVFEDVASREEALRVYKRKCLCSPMRKEHRLLGKYKIKLGVPAEPSNIKWENIEHSAASRCCRILFGAAVILLLLVASAALIYLLKIVNQDEATKETCLAYEG